MHAKRFVSSKSRRGFDENKCVKSRMCRKTNGLKEKTKFGYFKTKSNCYEKSNNAENC